MKRLCITALALATAGLGTAAVRAQETPAPAAPAKAAAKPEIWTDNFEAAKAQAASAGKDILIDFTGSDWCGWCIKLKKEVFDKPEFTAEAPNKFVLVEADFPSKKTLAEKVKDQNAKLQQAFGVQGFPTIFLLDGAGRPYAQTGYRPGGPAAYLKHLAELQNIRLKRDEAWKKAETAQGVEKAKLLAEGLKAMDETLAETHYGSVLAELGRLDPQDTTGIVKKFAAKARMAALEQEVAKAVHSAKGDDAPALKVISDFIAANKPAGEDLQKVLLLKVNLYPPRSAENIDKAIKVTEEVVAVDANTETGKQAQRIKQAAEIYKQRLAAKAAAKKAAEANAPAADAAAK